MSLSAEAMAGNPFSSGAVLLGSPEDEAGKAWIAKNKGWMERARERWTPRAATPLRIRVHLRSSGFAYDPYIGVQIEGALQHVVVLLETSQMPADIFAGKPRHVRTDIQIPIADTTILGWPIAMASWGHFPAAAVESVRWLRKRARTSVLSTPGGRGILLTAGGPFKSLNLPVARMTTAWVDFYVRGDRAMLSELCRNLTSIGRHRTHAEVGWVEIEDDSEDSALWRGSVPQRSIPVTQGTSGAREVSTRAPYWNVASRTLCIVPE